MYRQRLGQAITQCLRYLHVYMVNLSFALSTPNQFNPRPPQTCFQNMQINERDTRTRNSNWNWDTDTQTEIEIETELAVRYLWDTRARRELSNAISQPAARFDGSLCWRFVAELALVFENLDSFIWAALKTKRIRQIRNTTRLRQKYNNNKQKLLL